MLRSLVGSEMCIRDRTIAQRTPAVAPQKKSWRSQAQFFHQLDRPSATRSKRSTQNTEEKLKTSIAASPSLSRAWRSRDSSAHSKEAESDKRPSLRRQKRTEAVGGEHATMHAVALICSPRYLSAACCVICCFFRSHKIYNFENNTRTWFANRTQSRIFPPNREVDS